MKVEIKELINQIHEEKKDEWKLMIEKISKVNSDYWESYTENLNDKTQLKIHKVLYFLYGFFYQETGKELFNPNFKMYKHGPVEMNYHLNKKIELEFEKNDEKRLKTLLYKIIKYNEWKLIELIKLTNPIKNKVVGDKIYSKKIRDYFLLLSDV